VKYFIIAGEASGDLHASNLVKGIRAFDTDAVITGWGGDLMKAQGVQILKHISELSFMGFIEVLKNIRTIKKNFKTCYKHIEEQKPDAVILVDFPGFNLRVAKKVFGKVKKLYYYISPTVWAWHRSRMYTVRDFTNRMFVILPFEKDFYAKYGIDVDFEGHPLLDALPINHQSHSELYSENANIHPSRNIAIFPGSRHQEISAILPVMLGAAKKLGNEYKYILAAAPNIEDNYYKNILREFPVELSREGSYSVLLRSCAAMVTSGTATLETGLIGVPQVVCYSTSAVSFRIAKTLVNVKYISLVNLILDEPLVKELIQNELSIDSLFNEIKLIIPGGEKHHSILEGYNRLRSITGGPGASYRIAEKMYKGLCDSV